MRVRLDYTTRQGRYYQQFYHLLPGDTNDHLVDLDRKMEWLRRQHLEGVLFAMDDQDQINHAAGFHGELGSVEQCDGIWHCWRENGLV